MTTSRRFRFKIWDQARDNSTIGLRVTDFPELNALATHLLAPDVYGTWTSLQAYLDASLVASSPVERYTREVDVLVQRADLGIPQWSFCQRRRLCAVYTGRERQSGGFSSQCYVILDPAWTSLLTSFVN
jgi:hypothetical protein